MTTKPDLTRTWAAGAPGGNIEDPDITVPGKFDAGWAAEIPPFENFNFLQQLFSQGLANLNEQGIFQYDVVTDYPVDGLAKGTDGNTYRVLITNGPATSVVDPVGDLTDTWILAVTNYEDMKGGRKNLLINAAFRINERNYVSGTATTSANQFTVDRWRVVVSGQSVTFSALGTDNTLTCPAGGLASTVEAGDVDGGDYVIFWEGTATCTVGGIARNKGETFTLVANTNVIVEFRGGTLKHPQLETGTFKTVFEFLRRYVDLQICKFYGRSYNGSNAAGQVVATTAGRYSVSLGDGMRIAPTLTLVVSNGSVTNAIGSNLAVTSLTSTGNSKEHARLLASVASGLVVGNASQILLGNFFLDSELV